VSDNIYNNDSKEEAIKLNILPVQQNSLWFDSLRQAGISNTKIHQLNAITDNLGRHDRFEYNATFKNYQDHNAIYFSTAIPIYLLKKIRYSTGKQTDFTYLNHIPATYYIFQNPLYASFSDFMNATHRDKETNFMIDYIQRYNKYEDVYSIYQKMQYIYGSNSQYSNSIDAHETENIYTGVITINKIIADNSSPDSTISVKYFNKYRVLFRTDYHSDLAYTIKLKREVQTTASQENEIIYYFNKGNLNTDFLAFDGNFLTDSIVQKETNLQTSTNLLKVTRFQYGLNTLEFGVLTLQDKSYIGHKTEIDPNGLETYINYYSQPPDLLNPNGKYIFNLISDQKKSKGGKILSWDSFEYNTITSSPGFGKLKSKTDKRSSNINKQIRTEYKYFEECPLPAQFKILNPNLYKWHPLETKVDGKVSTVYYYPTDGWDIDSSMYDPGGWKYIFNNNYQIIDSFWVNPRYKYFYNFNLQVNGKVLKTNNSIVDTVLKLNPVGSGPYFPFPYRTEIIYNNGQDTLRQYSEYNRKGNLLKEIDINGYYSELFYDPMGRILKANLPGSFQADNYLFIDTNLIQISDEILLNNRIGINEAGTIENNSTALYNYGGIENINAPIENYAIESYETSIMDESGPGGGGGGSNEGRYNFLYWLLPEKIRTSMITELVESKLSFYTGRNYSTPEQDSSITLYVISDTLNRNYVCLDSLTFNFTNYTLKEINLVNLINNLKGQGKDLLGFAFKTKAVGT
jgi:hypothetical protein